ncbi:MAG: YhbY family RNA-binding protein [Methanocalculus sp.]|uniref:YhbY family RNA-binding protein n=1 Tax=Methanocalculus sp. TaxID=2004547 RepID=UPI00271F7943|nr:YhbY family RNA-binding protein [Methanocalculus sp.]MDO8841411.1 YhbY family RNA-binding protein [Methanocalculus sp.]MDO9540109.1 YhbY family RNA-binding protein [Methanocalculus sp.]
MKPTIWVGKQGVTAEVTSEVRSQLEVRKVIKVKWLKNAPMDPEAIVSGTGGVVITTRGRMMVIAKKR